MKNIIKLYALLFFPIVIFSQTNREIAGVYFKKAEVAMSKIDYSSALKDFDKGVEVIGKIEEAQIAEMGVLINYELKRYRKGLEYSQIFFILSQKKTSEQYTQMLELFVEMKDKLKQKEEEEKKKALEKLAKEKELRKKDSLKQEWKALAANFTIKLDTLLPFNADKLGLFKKGNYHGLISDEGAILLEATIYKYALQNEGFVLFLDSKEKPKNIYCYDTKKRQGYELPPASRFNQDSDYYSKVMFPRGDGRIVLYPENSFKTVVYILDSEKAFEISEDNLKQVLKDLKKNDMIEKYDRKERTVRVNGEWYTLGNYLEGGVFTLYHSEEKKILGFLITQSNNPHVLGAEKINYLGNFYKDKFQGFKGNEAIWLQNNGEEGTKPKSKFLNYTGDTKIFRLGKGMYQLKKNNIVFLKNKKLEPLASFLKRNR